jgi:hypothetical protein
LQDGDIVLVNRQVNNHPTWFLSFSMHIYDETWKICLCDS